MLYLDTKVGAAFVQNFKLLALVNMKKLRLIIKLLIFFLLYLITYNILTYLSITFVMLGKIIERQKRFFIKILVYTY